MTQPQRSYNEAPANPETPYRRPAVRKVRRGGILNSGKRRKITRPPDKQRVSAAETKSEPRRVKRREPGLRIYDGDIDMLFFSIVIVLLVFGIIMMFSASYIAGLNSKSHDGYMYVRTQGFAAVLGVVAMVFISFRGRGRGRAPLDNPRRRGGRRTFGPAF